MFTLGEVVDHQAARAFLVEEQISFNGEKVHTRYVACDAVIDPVVDPVGRGDEEQGDAGEHLGYDV